MEIKRRKSKVIKIGNLLIGGKHSIAIQSMTKTKTSDLDNTVRQIKQLEDAGCQIVRLAIKDSSDAAALKKIKAKTKLPLVADIHFSYRLAIAAIENGADKLRLNPGNIDKPKEIEMVVRALRSANIPLRIGLNSGSLKDIGPRKSSITDKPEGDGLASSGQSHSQSHKPRGNGLASDKPEGNGLASSGQSHSQSHKPRGNGLASNSQSHKLVASCMDYVQRIEGLKFDKIVISLKANNVLDTVEAYRKIAGLCSYPLHLGVTATGPAYNGMIKSSVALGALLLEGIGDTIRVSLTDNPIEEVRAAKCILESLGLIDSNIQVISCPTCGRCEVDLISIVKDLETRLSSIVHRPSAKPIKLAIMGCLVNGPGEAKEADMGIAFGKSAGLFFNKGKAVRKIPFKDCAKTLLEEMEKIK